MWFLKLRKLAREAGREALILWFAVRDRRTPLPLKIAAGAALGYLVSPIDLLPDVLLIGWIDDLVLLSLGVPYLIRSLPDAVRIDAEARADEVIALLGLTVGGKTRPRRKASGSSPRSDASHAQTDGTTRSGRIHRKKTR